MIFFGLFGIMLSSDRKSAALRHGAARGKLPGEIREGAP
jgi:hypothetical protein